MIVETTLHSNQYRLKILALLRLRVNYHSVSVTLALVFWKWCKRSGLLTVIHLENRLEPANFRLDNLNATERDGMFR